MSAKSSISACPKCGTALPLTAKEGLCPRCLFALLGTEEAAPEETAPGTAIPGATTELTTLLRPEFGDYEILEEIGQGGMGTVYRARQLSLNRAVAIKVIKLGMDTQAVIARFEAERHALALMDHPGIARVFDAGATKAGRPYFVMELVHGARITEHCARHGVPLRGRLELFIKVCHAVQHAHQKGIIHRDLKPSNILVTELDGQAVPKVIDFGIAKAIETRLTEQTAFTEAGQLVGTPAYLSPEQAELGGLDIDTRSDIYSLGVLLYELLTGHLPFDTQQLAKASLDQVRRIIREQQPLRPSTRLGRERVAIPTDTAAKSKIKTQNSKISSDLDWIVMKCLEKERARRYATANGLAADLQRHLDNEPVLARPPSRAYEFQKSVRRHWVGFTAVAAVLAILVIGVLVSTFEAVRARQAEQRERKVVYAAKMGLIQAAWEQGRIVQVHQLLEETAAYPDRGFEWYYWQRLVRPELKVLRGHLGGVGCVAWSPDGKRVAAGSNDRTVIVWDAVSGGELFALKAHVNEVDAVAFSPDGQRIVTAGHDHLAIIWDAQTGKKLLTFEGHTGRIQSAAFSPDSQWVVTASWDSTARIWDPTTGKQLLCLRHTGPINDTAFSPDGQRIVTGSDDKTARVWDAMTGNQLLRLTGHSNAVLYVAYSSDGQIATGGDTSDPTVRVWEAATGRQLHVLAGHGGEIRAIQFSPNGRQIAAISHDQVARVWDAATGNLLFALKGYTQQVNDLAYSPDGTRIITGHDDGTARIWDAVNDREAFSLILRVPDGSLEAAFSPDGRRIVAQNGKTADVWDAVTGEPLFALQGHHGLTVRCVAFSPDGRRIVTGSTDSTAKVWDAANGNYLFTLTGHIATVKCVAFSPDGRLIATGGTDSTAMLWESASGHHVLTFTNHTQRIIDLAFSADSRRIATASADTTAKVWDPATGTQLFEIKDPDGIVAAVAFSPDGRQLATTCTNGTAKLWDTASGKRLQTFRGHPELVRGVAFSPDGRRIVTAGNEGTAKVWDTASGEEVLTLRAHDDNVDTVAFSPDGRRILTSSTDRTVKVWDAATAEELARWRTEESNAAERLAALARESVAHEQEARSSSVHDPGAIKQWLFLGPISYDGRDGAMGLAEEQVAGEALLRPRVDQGIQGSDLRWRAIQLPDYIVNFHNLYGADPGWVVAYLVCYIQSDSDQDRLVIKVGSEDQSKVYLNGKEIYRCEKARKYVPDQDAATTGVKLLKGTNVLVFKVVNEADTPHASIRFTNAAGRPLKGIRVTLTP